MTDFADEDLSGSQFERVRLTDATLREVDLSGSRFYNVYLTGAVLRGAWVQNVDIDGAVMSLRVNGVDVAEYVEKELDRRYPERAKMRPTDAAGYREAWDILERLWGETVDRARTFPPDLLNERVDGEWSFLETLRHLVMATDAWVLRAVLGQPNPYHPLGLPHDEMPNLPGVPWDRTLRPSLDEVLAARVDRMATVRRVLADLTDDQLAGMTEPVHEPGYPEPGESFAVRRCLGAILTEEWEHRLYAERDMDELQSRQS